MKRSGSIIILMLLVSTVSFAQLKLQNLLTENLANPIVLDITQPRFSWQLVSDRRNTMQTAYEIKVTLNNTIVWSSGKVNSDSSVHVSYKGARLQSGKKYSWQVRAWDNHGNETNWSAPSFFQMGLLSTSDWKARWIEPGYTEDS